jgi:type IV pilus assembly protein PilP
MRKTQKTGIKISGVVILGAGLLLAAFLPAGMPPALAAGPPAPAKADARVTVDPAKAKPEVQQADYRYNPAGKADPFRSFVEEEVAREAARKKASGVQATTTAAVNILQRHEAHQYILVGVASDETGRSAMVVDPTKKYFFVVNVGTHIGSNMGRVSAILHDKIIVDEQVRMDSGKPKPRRVVISFQ